MINRMCVKVQDHLNSLRNSETDSVMEDVKMAENYMRDAKNSKTVVIIIIIIKSSSTCKFFYYQCSFASALKER